MDIATNVVIAAGRGIRGLSADGKNIMKIKSKKKENK